jgi:hypothetical protein
MLTLLLGIAIGAIGAWAYDKYGLTGGLSAAVAAVTAWWTEAGSFLSGWLQ